MIRTYLSFTICGDQYAVNVAKVGIYKLNNEFIMLLNVEKVFSGAELQTIKSTTI